MSDVGAAAEAVIFPDKRDVPAGARPPTCCPSDPRAAPVTHWRLGWAGWLQIPPKIIKRSGAKHCSGRDWECRCLPLVAGTGGARGSQNIPAWKGLTGCGRVSVLYRTSRRIPAFPEPLEQRPRLPGRAAASAQLPGIGVCSRRDAVPSWPIPALTSSFVGILYFGREFLIQEIGMLLLVLESPWRRRWLQHPWIPRRSFLHPLDLGCAAAFGSRALRSPAWLWQGLSTRS